MRAIVKELATGSMDEFFRVRVDYGEVIERAPGKIISKVKDLACRENVETKFFPGARGFSTLLKQNRATLTRLGGPWKTSKTRRRGREPIS